MGLESRLSGCCRGPYLFWVRGLGLWKTLSFVVVILEATLSCAHKAYSEAVVFLIGDLAAAWACRQFQPAVGLAADAAQGKAFR